MKRNSTNTDQSIEIPETRARHLRWLLYVASMLFILGLFLPMLTISKFVFIRNSFSVFTGVLELLLDGQILLFVLVGGFSIILPILKIGVLYKILSRHSSSNPRTKRYLHLMHEYGRWAMLDVMVVAILIVTVKLGVVASVEVHSGLFVFGASVLLIMLITNRIVGLTQDERGRTKEPDPFDFER